MEATKDRIIETQREQVRILENMVKIKDERIFLLKNVIEVMEAVNKELREVIDKAARDGKIIVMMEQKYN